MAFIPPTPQPVGQRVRQSFARQLPQIAVLAGVVVAVIVVADHHFRRGTLLVGLSLLLHAALRLVLTERRAGWLAVRSRFTDVLISTAFGTALVVLTLTVPAPS